MARGRLQSTWLYLRRVVAVAELMGLPGLARLFEMRTSRGEPVDLETARRARLWINICVLDRISGSLSGLPVATRRYDLINFFSNAAPGGNLQTLEYMIKLSSVAMEITDLDGERASSSAAECYSIVTYLDKRLKMLGAAMPPEWQMEKELEFTPGNLINLLQSAITMHLHVRYVLVDDDANNSYQHNRITGIEACQSLSYHWRRIRAVMPFGLFLYILMDLQAFAATVTMIMVAADSNHARFFQHIDRNQLTMQIEQNMEVLEASSRQPLSSIFLRKAVATLQNLRALLRGDVPIVDSANLVLNVPLLGRVHIRRNQYISQPNNSLNTNIINYDQQHLQQNQSTDPDSMIAATKPESYEALTWMIEDNGEALFQDFLMMEDSEDWSVSST